MQILISIVFILFYVKYVVTSECYWNTGCKYKYFSSKTPYEIIRGDIRDSVVKRKEFSGVGCEVVSIWSIMRHGKRNPSLKFIQNMKEFLKYKEDIISSYEIGNSSLCAQDIENIKNWRIDSDLFDRHNEIASEGYQEFVGIGSRLREAFPEVLNELQRKDYLFLTAFGRRMLKSAEALIEGLNQNSLVIKTGKNDYSVLAPYATCGKYQIDVRQNPNIYFQEDIYTRTADYLNMKERVERKLGLNVTISRDNITAMYDLCRYTWDGINNKPSPWCALFSVEDLQVLEYIGDIRHYYRNGYGITSQYNKMFGQIPLTDLLKKFQEAKKGRGKSLVTYITHATMMDMILVTLNLHKDKDPLTGIHRDINRKWRTTFLSPFANNLIAVLNRCSTHGYDNYDYNVALYWNEMPLLELCNGGVCSWQEFENIFKPFLNTTLDFCEFKWTIVD